MAEVQNRREVRFAKIRNYIVESTSIFVFGTWITLATYLSQGELLAFCVGITSAGIWVAHMMCRTISMSELDC